MSETFPGGGYVTPGSLPQVPTSGTVGIPVQQTQDKPDAFYVEGLRCAVQMFQPLDGSREMGQDEDALWWGNVTRYADAMASYLRSRSQAPR